MAGIQEMLQKRAEEAARAQIDNPPIQKPLEPTAPIAETVSVQERQVIDLEALAKEYSSPAYYSERVTQIICRGGRIVKADAAGVIEPKDDKDALELLEYFETQGIFKKLGV